MRIAILSDVHSNLAALEAVLRHALRQGSGQAQAQGPSTGLRTDAIDAVWCLGDSVGYGPQPRECIARLRELDAVLVAGNHDRAATGAMSTEEFNADAAAAARWTMGQLNPEERAYLDSLPEVLSLSAGQDPSLKAEASEAEFTLVHGTLRWPIWEYLYSYEAAQAHLQLQQSPFGLVGHTHVPMLVAEGEEFPHGCEMYYLEDGNRVRLTRPAGRGERKLVLNPGGVGQPRDGDPRAAYALYDREDETFTLHRVEYDIAATQKLMETAGLPRWLIDRLALGR